MPNGLKSAVNKFWRIILATKNLALRIKLAPDGMLLDIDLKVAIRTLSKLGGSS